MALLLGSNLGNRYQNLTKAQQLLQAAGLQVQATSAIWETAPWGSNSQFSYYNQAVVLETQASAEDLMQLLLAVEQQMGRERGEPNADRIIDLDMLLYEQLIYQSAVLQLPHPRMHKRRFVLAPLAEVAADWIHPTLGLRISELLERCSDELSVNRLEVVA